MAESQTISNAIPVESYLRGCVGYSVTDDAITSILFNRGIQPGSYISDMTKKQLDLSRADVYMWCSLLPSVSGTVSDADAGWKHSEGGMQASSLDKSNLISMANAIYLMYGESPRKSTIRMSPRGMRVWRR